MGTAAMASALSLLCSEAAANSAPPQSLWEIKAMAGVPCRATLDNPVLDTKLMRNRDDHMVLIAASPSWELSGPIKFALAIDDGSPFDLQGVSVGPLVLVVVSDSALENNLRLAKTLSWHFTFGDFRVPVSGLGAAYDQIKACPG